MVYDAVSRSLLSIKNYHDDSLVDSCYSKGCSVMFTAWVHISQDSRLFTLSSSYLGSDSLVDTVVVTGVNMAFGD